MKIHNSSGIEIADIIVSDESYRYRAIMGEDALTIKFELPTFINIPIGSYVEYQAERYTLISPQNFIKNNTRDYEYTLILESAKGSLTKYKLRDTVSKRLKFTLTAKPHEFLQLVVDNMNRRESGWTAGECLQEDEKVLSFSFNSCLEALQMIADEFDTEWEVTTKKISLKKVEHNTDNPLQLSYGKGNGFISGVRRENNTTKSRAIEILYTQGGTRNIDASKYGSSELLLPISQQYTYEGKTYETDDQGFSIKRANKALVTKEEGSVDCSEIYPKREGVISSVITVNQSKNEYDFVDDTIPDSLDFVKHIIKGETMMVIFQSGMLSGREFEVKYKHDAIGDKIARRFEIVSQEVDGQTMPNEDFKPAPEDKYIVFNIELPKEYVCDNENQKGASWEMLKKGAKYLSENENPHFTFIGQLDPNWTRKNWLNIGGRLKLGSYILFKDSQFIESAEGVKIRIVGIKDFINDPYTPEIELSNVSVGTSISVALGKIETTQVTIDKKTQEAIQYTKRGFKDIKETTRLLEAALTNFSGSINPITVQTMQLIIGDASLQFRFVNSKTEPIPVKHKIEFNQQSKKITSDGGIIQHMTIGIKNITSSRTPSQFHFWSLPEFETPPLTNPEIDYYLFAKVSKTNQTGEFIISEQPIELDAVVGFYHLLVAVISRENEGERGIAILYGFTEILPGRITTEKIISSDGKTFFDLEAGEIGGNISFITTDGDYKDVGNKMDDVEDSIEEVAANVNYRVEIISTNGNAFRNDNIETTLIAMVYRGKYNITSTLPESAFRWKRTSDNPEGDTTWNNIHATFYSSILSITGDDVDGKAVFNCEVLIE